MVKAVAAGVDISSALADLNAPLPLYRFNVLLQKANEVCNDVKALGGALLAALEKKDAEALGLLRQSQEIRLLEAVKAVRETADRGGEGEPGRAQEEQGTGRDQDSDYYESSRIHERAGETAAIDTLADGPRCRSIGRTIIDWLASIILIPDIRPGRLGLRRLAACQRQDRRHGRFGAGRKLAARCSASPATIARQRRSDGSRHARELSTAARTTGIFRRTSPTKEIEQLDKSDRRRRTARRHRREGARQPRPPNRQRQGDR